MKAAHSSTQFKPFVISDKIANDLDCAIASFGDHETITAECSDGIERIFEDVSQLVAYQNAPAKHIVKLTWRNFSLDGRTSVVLRFSNRKYVNVFFDIQGEETDVLDFIENIENILDAARPWYALILHFDFIYILSAGMFLWSIFRLILLLITDPASRVFPQFNIKDFTSKTALLSFTPLSLGILLNIFRNRCFPSGVFAIGLAIHAHQRNETWRIGFVLSALASILVSIVILMLS